MRVRVVVVLGIAMILLGGWKSCGADVEPAGEAVAAAIPGPEAESGSEADGRPAATETETVAETETETETEIETLATSSEATDCTSVPADLPLADRCKMAGAVVHTFPNTCVGGCKAAEQMMMCGAAMTEGCKCPDGQCIDETTGCCREIRR